MSNFKIINRGCQEAYADEIIALIEKFSSIVPKWVLNIYVHENVKENATLECISDFDYCNIRIYVPDNWATWGDEAAKGKAILHEICHLYTTVQYEMLVQYSGSHGLDMQKARQHAGHMLEHSTEALCMLIYDLLNEGKRDA